ncbi:MAG: PDZ domain-containing protein [Desulfovibrionaceae bacterium]
MPHFLTRCLWLAMAVLMVAGCDLKAKPIELGRQTPRPQLGLKVKVVEAKAYLGEFDEDQDRALLVMDVKPDSPAGAVGIKPGDLLLRMDDKVVQGMRDSVFIMQLKKPGDTVVLDVFSNGELHKLGVEIPAGTVKE